MPIILAADHGGFAHKQEIKNWLTEQGRQVIDVGAATVNPQDDFPDFVALAVKAYREQPATSRLLLWCRSGVGVCLAANRYPGIHCGFALSQQQIKDATRDDHLNALALAAGYQELALQRELITIFLTTQPSPAPRFLRRLKKLEQYSRA